MHPRATTARRPRPAASTRAPSATPRRAVEPLERLGQWAGGLLAPLVFLGAALRRDRLFHPVGVVHEATVRRLDGELARALPDLSGAALVRFSGALWRTDRWPDVLGCAVRLRPGRPSGPAPADQDLLFATIGSAAALPAAPFMTDPVDYLSSTYNALGWFAAGALEVKLRLIPVHVRPAGGVDRADRLASAVRAGQAALQLEARRRGGGWEPIAAVEVHERVVIDDRAMAFDPFHDGRGLTPRGFLQFLRRWPYRASRAARGARARS